MMIDMNIEEPVAYIIMRKALNKLGLRSMKGRSGPFRGPDIPKEEFKRLKRAFRNMCTERLVFVEVRCSSRKKFKEYLEKSNRKAASETVSLNPKARPQEIRLWLIMEYNRYLDATSSDLPRKRGKKPYS